MAYIKTFSRSILSCIKHIVPLKIDKNAKKISTVSVDLVFDLVSEIRQLIG